MNVIPFIPFNPLTINVVKYYKNKTVPLITYIIAEINSHSFSNLSFYLLKCTSHTNYDQSDLRIGINHYNKLLPLPWVDK